MLTVGNKWKQWSSSSPDRQITSWSLETLPMSPLWSKICKKILSSKTRTTRSRRSGYVTVLFFWLIFKNTVGPRYMPFLSEILWIWDWNYGISEERILQFTIVVGLVTCESIFKVLTIENNKGRLFVCSKIHTCTFSDILIIIFINIIFIC